MTNGDKKVTQRFLDRSGLDFVRPVLDVEGPRCWKPCRRAYEYVCSELGLQPAEVTIC
jgi:FMN phosphatase YigB (HAD superfamily)